ncbi:MAG: DUF4197 domain-containing protein, partial [Crocinitomicaceae bacterium]|nr:DUF4197 domain-containing protein [Crocinitomicaceae bacterium]
MKQLIIILISIFSLTSCDVLEEAADILTTETVGSSTPSLSNDEAISGLKEALNIGITNAVYLTSETDGYLKNSAIVLPFPEDAIKVKQKALDWGLNNQVKQFETTLNRAAEEATKEALPIFKDAIVNMRIQDGFSILNGGEGAATTYLKNNTTTALVAAFSPKVERAITKVQLTKYWNPIITKYNAAMKLTGGDELNSDLTQYVTERAITGLFYMVEEEENKIR